MELAVTAALVRAVRGPGRLGHQNVAGQVYDYDSRVAHDHAHSTSMAPARVS